MNTIQASTALSVNGPSPISRTNTYSVTQSGSNTAVLTQNIATSATQITLGNVSGVPPALLIRNLDATNYVEVDANTSFNGFPQKILPGAAILLAPEIATIYAKAHTTAVLVEISTCDA